jgi:hypothetical protein
LDANVVSPLFEIASVLVCLDHVAGLVVNANHWTVLALLAIPTSSKHSSTRRREKTKRERNNSPALRTIIMKYELSSPEGSPRRLLNQKASERSSTKIDPEKFKAFVNAAESGAAPYAN